MKPLLTGAMMALSLTATLLGACAGGDDDGSMIEATPDAAPGPDTIAEACAVEPDLGDLGTLPAERSIAVRSTNNANQETSITFIGALNVDQDQLVIQLYRGFGAFSTSTIGTGSFVIEDEELDYATCGVCVLVFADRPFGGGEPEQVLMATGGTLDVLELGPTGSGRFRATLSDVTFEHVTIASTTFASTPVGDGCTTSIGHLVTDAPITGPMP